MAWTREEIFDDIADGNLENDADWTTIGGEGSDFVVGAAYKLFGTKGVKAQTGGAYIHCALGTDKLTAGTWYWAFKIITLDSGKGAYIKFFDGNRDNCVYVRIWNDGGTYKLTYFDGVSHVFLVNIAANTKYIVKVIFDGSLDSGNGQAKIGLYDVDASTWLLEADTFRNTKGTCPEIDGIELETDHVDTVIYFDEFTAIWPIVPPSPNLTSKNNYNGYLAFIQQYIKHKINDTTPWKNPDGTLIE